MHLQVREKTEIRNRGLKDTPTCGNLSLCAYFFSGYVTCCVDGNQPITFCRALKTTIDVRIVNWKDQFRKTPHFFIGCKISSLPFRNSDL